MPIERPSYASHSGALRLFAGLPAVVLFACAPGDSGPEPFVVQDSAGTAIAESRVQAWQEGEGWRVGPDPIVVIGQVEGDPRYEFLAVREVTFWPGDRIVLLNAIDEVRAYDLDGTFVWSAGQAGDGPGDFGSTLAIWPHAGDSLAVSDNRLQRVSYWDSDGQFGRVVSTSHEGDEGFASQISGGFPSGEMFGWGGTSSFTSRDRGLLQDSLRMRIHDASGSFARLIGQVPATPRWGGEDIPFAFIPMTVDIWPVADGEYILVARSSAPEIQLWNPDGSLDRIIRWDPRPRPVSAEMRSAFIEDAVASASEGRRAAIRRFYGEVPFPDVLPEIRAVLTDSDGRVWAQRYHPSDDTAEEWIVFDPDGRWLGPVTLPDRFVLNDVSGDRIVGVERDDLDVERVVVYALVK